MKFRYFFRKFIIGNLNRLKEYNWGSERKYDEPRAPCISRYKSAMLRVVCWLRVKTWLSRANGEKELDLWPTSSFSPVRHAYPPTRRRSGFLGHGCTRGRFCVSILSPRGPRGEALLVSYHHGRTDWRFAPVRRADRL